MFLFMFYKKLGLIRSFFFPREGGETIIGRVKIDER